MKKSFTNFRKLLEVGLKLAIGGHGGRVVTLSHPTSEAGFGSREGWYLLTVQNPDERYVLVSSALPTTRRDMTCTVMKAM